MRHYTVNRIKHVVYDDLKEVPSKVQVIENWRNGVVGAWVKSDDGCVIQVLRRGTMMRVNGTRDYIGTCTGTFICMPNVEMDTQPRANRYSFGGYDTHEQTVISRNKLTTSEKLFVQYLASGMQPQEAYIKAFPTNNPAYARMKSVQLVKTERVMTAMKEELRPIMEKLGISEEQVLSGIKHEAETADKPDTRLKALFKLSDILDLEDKNAPTVQQVTGVAFQGFSGNELETAERKKIGE
jgi:hypothetical protein